MAKARRVRGRRSRVGLILGVVGGLIGLASLLLPAVIVVATGLSLTIWSFVVAFVTFGPAPTTLTTLNAMVGIGGLILIAGGVYSLFRPRGGLVMLVGGFTALTGAALTSSVAIAYGVWVAIGAGFVGTLSYLFRARAITRVKQVTVVQQAQAPAPTPTPAAAPAPAATAAAAPPPAATAAAATAAAAPPPAPEPPPPAPGPAPVVAAAAVASTKPEPLEAPQEPTPPAAPPPPEPAPEPTAVESAPEAPSPAPPPEHEARPVAAAAVVGSAAVVASERREEEKAEPTPKTPEAPPPEAAPVVAAAAAVSIAESAVENPPAPEPVLGEGAAIENPEIASWEAAVNEEEDALSDLYKDLSEGRITLAAYDERSKGHTQRIAELQGAIAEKRQSSSPSDST